MCMYMYMYMYVYVYVCICVCVCVYVYVKKCLHFSICACHLCAWGHANLLCIVPILTEFSEHSPRAPCFFGSSQRGV